MSVLFVPLPTAKVGASLTAVTVMLRVAVLLLPAPSLSVNDTVRVCVLGLSLLLK